MQNLSIFHFSNQNKNQPNEDNNSKTEKTVKQEFLKRLNIEYQQEIEKIKQQEKISQEQLHLQEQQQQQIQEVDQQKQAKLKQHEYEQKKILKLQEIQQKQENIKNFQQKLSLDSQQKLVQKPPKRVKNKYIIFQNHMMKFLRNELKADRNAIKSSWLYQKVKQYWEGKYESEEIKEYVEKIKVLCEQEAEFQKELYQTQMKQYQDNQKSSKRIFSPFVYYANDNRQKYIGNPEKFQALYEELKAVGFQEYLWQKEQKKQDKALSDPSKPKLPETFKEFQTHLDERFLFQEKPSKNVMNLSSLLGFKWTQLPENEKKKYIELRDSAEQTRLQTQKQQQDFQFTQTSTYSGSTVPFKKKYSGYVVFLNEQKRQNHVQLDKEILQQIEEKKQSKLVKSYTKGQKMIQYYAQLWRGMSESEKLPYKQQAEVLNSQLLRQQKQFIQHYGVDKNDMKKIKKEIEKNKKNKLALKAQKSISMKNYLTDKKLQNETDNFYDSEEEFLTSDEEQETQKIQEVNVKIKQDKKLSRSK